MADETKVTIAAWPKDPAALEHHFSADSPCPVSISFTDSPAHVVVSTEPQQPLAVNMNMQLTAREPIPLCIKLCEPICARSDYTIGINVFDNPVASINVRGTTRLEACRDTPTNERECVAFDNIKAGTTFPSGFEQQGLKFSPLGGELRAATFGEPAGRTKLAFADPGMRIDFGQPVEDILLTLSNYASPDLKIVAFSGGSLVTEFVVSISNTFKEVTISQSGITSLTVSGGSNEATLVEVCYRPASHGPLLSAAG